MVLNAAMNKNNLELPPVLLLSAGYGKRLAPITDSKPKPLVELAGKSLLERHLEFLAASGFKRVFINLHHLGQQIVDFVADGSAWGLEVTYSWEQELLDTGGALRPIEPLLASSEICIVNSDSLFLDPPDFIALLEIHRSKSPLATLLLREDPLAASFGSLEIDQDGCISRFLNTTRPADPVVSTDQAETRREVMYCGVMILSSRVISLLPECKSSSLTGDVLVPALAQGESLFGLLHTGRWFDVGTHQRLEAAKQAVDADLGL